MRLTLRIKFHAFYGTCFWWKKATLRVTPCRCSGKEGFESFEVKALFLFKGVELGTFLWQREVHARFYLGRSVCDRSTHDEWEWVWVFWG